MSQEKDKPFHEKEWFMWLMLVILAPVGLFYLWRNKKYTSKAKWIMTGAFSVWFIIIGIAAQPTEEEKAEEAAKQEQREEEREQKKQEKEKERQEKKVKEEEQKMKEEEEEKKEEERLANRSIDEAIEEDNRDVDEAVLEDGILTLVQEVESTWSENTLFHNVYDLFEATHDAFEDESVHEVESVIKTVMIDNKGNDSMDPVINFTYTRESFEELNYDNFSNMAFANQWRILNESDAYFIHPGIYKNLKDKYTDNLSHRQSKVRSYD